MKLILATLTLILTIGGSIQQQQQCQVEATASGNKCNGVKCGADSECKSGVCYDDQIFGKNTCSDSNSCSSTIFNHYGRCYGVACEFGA